MIAFYIFRVQYAIFKNKIKKKCGSFLHMRPSIKIQSLSFELVKTKMDENNKEKQKIAYEN